MIGQYIIDEFITPSIASLPWIGKYGGVVQKLVKDSVNTNDQRVKVTYPVSCNVLGRDCANIGAYEDLVPNDKYRTVVYWEEISPMSQNGVSNTKRFGYKKAQGTYRLVCWFNLLKLGENGCIAPIAAYKQIERLTNMDIRLNSGEFTGSHLTIVPVRDVPRDADVVFGKYSYPKNSKYYLKPFDFFAIDYNFTLDYCMNSGIDYIPNNSIDCENGD